MFVLVESEVWWYWWKVRYGGNGEEQGVVVSVESEV